MNKSLREIGYNKKIGSLIINQTKLAKKQIWMLWFCSAKEVKSVKNYFKKEINNSRCKI